MAPAALGFACCALSCPCLCPGAAAGSGAWGEVPSGLLMEQDQGGKGADLPLDTSQRDDFCHKVSLTGSVFSGLVID